LYGFDDPYLELAAAIVVRAVRDVRSGRHCRVDGLACGTGNMAGVHTCEIQARRFLRSGYAAAMMTALKLNQAAVLEAIGE
jgi:hypothetical protein